MMMFSKSVDDAKASYTALTKEEDTGGRVRLYSFQCQSVTRFIALNQETVWRLITSIQRDEDFKLSKNKEITHMHTRLLELDQCTLETKEEVEGSDVRVPLCLDFDYIEPRMLKLSKAEQEERLVLHRMALCKLCQLVCHVLWLKQQPEKKRDKPYAYHYHPLVISPFVDENVEIFVSDASGKYKETYKVSSHVVIRLNNGAFSNLNSSKVLAEFLNETLENALSKTKMSEDECEKLIWNVAMNILPFKDFHKKGETTVLPFDVQIYNGRSLRMIGSFPRNGQTRLLRPCDTKTLACLNAPFSLEDVKNHDPFYVSYTEKKGIILRFGFKNASCSISLYKHVDAVCHHLENRHVNKFVCELLTVCLYQLNIPNPKKVAMKNILPVSKFIHVFDGKGRFTNFEFHFKKTTYCPWRYGREGCSAANHRSRYLVLMLFPERRARTPFFENAKPPLPMCRLVCFSKTCAHFCQQSSGCSDKKDYQQAFINVSTCDEPARRAAAFLLGEL